VPRYFVTLLNLFRDSSPLFDLYLENLNPILDQWIIATIRQPFSPLNAHNVVLLRIHNKILTLWKTCDYLFILAVALNSII
jgi:hypothetical protein